MKAAVFAYSRQGCKTARRVRELLNEEVPCYTMARFEEPGFQNLEKRIYGQLFSCVNAMIFVGSCGIAVREIAPHVKDKRTDPAVLCIDELGGFVIPLLSGHIGGGNALAVQLAEGLGATPVVTTATDINRRFSVDTWAKQNDCEISSMRSAKAVSAAILEGDVPMTSAFPVRSDLPNGVVFGDSGEVGISITYRNMQPYTDTLRLIPRVLHLGIGCRKGTEAAAIRESVRKVLEVHNIDMRAVKAVASIDLKAEEQGLLQCCGEMGWPITFYSAKQLQAVPGEFAASEFVKHITGVDNVCERAALINAETLIVNKTACNGVTVAVAAENWEVYFGETDRCGHRPR